MNYELLKEWINYRLGRPSIITSQVEFDGIMERYNNSLDTILVKSQELFKSEWERVKMESEHGKLNKRTFKEKEYQFIVKFHQLIRIAIGVSGIVIVSYLGIYLNNHIEDIATAATLIGFIGYTFYGLCQNIKEKAINSKQ